MDDVILFMEVTESVKKLKECVWLDDDQTPFGARVCAST